jgi:hypothetical protein
VNEAYAQHFHLGRFASQQAYPGGLLWSRGPKVLVILVRYIHVYYFPSKFFCCWNLFDLLPNCTTFATKVCCCAICLKFPSQAVVSVCFLFCFPKLCCC